MQQIEVSSDLASLDRALEALPNAPAVFLLWPKRGEPYLARTALLRRRLLRLLNERDRPSRLLNLRDSVAQIQYWLTGSTLESSFRIYQLARQHFPGTYAHLIKLRMPPYIKVILNNPFPRSQLTAHLARAPALYFGPFRTRSAAERFQSEFLDLFQMRRCQEDLEPSPQHPGCIYGEMSMCLRPCQALVGVDEYGQEVKRVIEFLSTNGRSLVEVAKAARDRFSEEMDFEEAARQHKRLERIQEVLKLKDELARDIDRLNGVAVTKSVVPNAAELWFVYHGWWQPPQRVVFEIKDGKPVSLDRTLREMIEQMDWKTLSFQERQEHLALLARWYYSSWRDGEWLPFSEPAELPYRQLVRAISRVMGR